MMMWLLFFISLVPWISVQAYVKTVMFKPSRSIKTWTRIQGSEEHGSSFEVSSQTVAIDDVEPYNGPSSDISLMEAGCVIEDIGLEVFVGQSSKPEAGRGTRQVTALQ
jgi:hypothetical protein